MQLEAKFNSVSTQHLGLHDKNHSILKLKRPWQLAIKLFPKTLPPPFFSQMREIETQKVEFARSVRRSMTGTTVLSFPKQSSFQDAIPQSAILTFYIPNFISLKQQRAKKKKNNEWNFMLKVELPKGTVVCFINEATEPCGTEKKGDIFS